MQEEQDAPGEAAGSPVQPGQPAKVPSGGPPPGFPAGSRPGTPVAPPPGFPPGEPEFGSATADQPPGQTAPEAPAVRVPPWAPAPPTTGGPPWAQASPVPGGTVSGAVARAAAARRAAATGPGHGGQRAGGRPDLVPWLIALATTAIYATISVFRYLRLDVGSWDLGIYTEYVRQLSRLRAPVVPIRSAGFNLLGDHFQPIVAVLAPVFRVFPTPLTLLLAQAVLTGLSVVPVCRAARPWLGTGPSRAIGAAYGLSWGLQQMINFDFHEVACAVPLLACSLSAVVRGRPRAALAWALPLVFVKEDQGFTVAALGLVMLLPAVRQARRGGQAKAATWTRGGLLLAGWGVAWSVLAITLIIPHFNVLHHYQYWQDGGVAGPGGHFSVTGLLSQFGHEGPEKLRTTAMLLLPAGFLALRSPLVLAAVPGLLLRFLSTDSYFWGTGWHYNATLMPVVFLAAIDGLVRFTDRRPQPAQTPRASRASRASRAGRGYRPAGRSPLLARASAAAMLVIAVVIAFKFPLSLLWQPSSYQVSTHVRAEDAAVSRVPAGTTVEATLSMLAPLAARDDTSWIGTTGIRAPAYIVYDGDNSGWSPPPAHPLRFLEQRHPGTRYQQVFEASNVYVFRRAASATGG